MRGHALSLRSACETGRFVHGCLITDEGAILFLETMASQGSEGIKNLRDKRILVFNRERTCPKALVCSIIASSCLDLSVWDARGLLHE